MARGGQRGINTLEAQESGQPQILYHSTILGRTYLAGDRSHLGSPVRCPILKGLDHGRRQGWEPPGRSEGWRGMQHDYEKVTDARPYVSWEQNKVGRCMSPIQAFLLPEPEHCIRLPRSSCPQHDGTGARAVGQMPFAVSGKGHSYERARRLPNLLAPRAVAAAAVSAKYALRNHVFHVLL
ncbi:hypothetical protein VTK73DRAFT_10415 [Phialemonium thermophilum]|uniref:Uncharacterized protein n=1 Tax=Phialemonium thermophilum TaxID=223376 RepID=A0ABR3VWZ1_9PEZI